MEEVIQFETAKLAYEKGFLLNSHNKYNPDGQIRDNVLTNKDMDAPYQSQLQKWLREKHNIIVVPDYNVNKRKYFHWLIIHGSTKEQSSFYDTWEQALELGLVRGLKQIK